MWLKEASIVGSGSQVTTDDESDGATCREFHQCEYDSDCAAQLGWDYVCESVDNFQSNRRCLQETAVSFLQPVTIELVLIKFYPALKREKMYLSWCRSSLSCSAIGNLTYDKYLIFQAPHVGHHVCTQITIAKL